MRRSGLPAPPPASGAHTGTEHAKPERIQPQDRARPVTIWSRSLRYPSAATARAEVRPWGDLRQDVAISGTAVSGRI
jgi:hypothetical protein